MDDEQRATIRKAIRNLEDGGYSESATAVWDLLDDYKSLIAQIAAEQSKKSSKPTCRCSTAHERDVPAVPGRREMVQAAQPAPLRARSNNPDLGNPDRTSRGVKRLLGLDSDEPNATRKWHCANCSWSCELAPGEKPAPCPNCADQRACVDCERAQRAGNTEAATCDKHATK